LPPDNWCREVPQSQERYKKIWNMLSGFLHSETAEIWDYKARKDVRLEIENVIRNTPVDLKIKTITEGSPHTLRLTKTQGTYELNLKKWGKDSELLAQLLKTD